MDTSHTITHRGREGLRDAVAGDVFVSGDRG